MLKKPNLIRAFLLLVIIISVLPFQNCSQKASEPEMLRQLASATEIGQEHGGEQEDHGLPEEPGESLEVIKSMMDGQLLASVFADVFGPAVLNFASLRRVKTEKAVFGGPCSVYDNFFSARAGFKIDAEATPCAHSQSANSLMAPIHPAANVLQQALINKVCTDGIDNATTFAYVIKQLKESAGVAIPANTPENAGKLFALFYRGKPVPPAELLSSMQLLVGEPATLAGWKAAILNTCLSSHWQAL